MAFHVGFHFYAGEALAFNTDTKETIEIKFEECLDVTHLKEEEFSRILSKFEVVKLKINGTRLGCACICLSCGCDYKIRSLLISSGLKFGFKEVSIIDRKTAQYLNAVSQSNYIPNDGDFIWVYNTVGIWCSIWQKLEQNVKYVDDVKGDINNLEKTIRRHKLYDSPNYIFYEKQQLEVFLLCDLLPDVQFHEFQSSNHVEGALIKARIMGGETHLAGFQTNVQLGFQISVEIKGKNILSCSNKEILPFEKSIKVKSNGSEKMIKVFINSTVEEVALPSFDKFLLIVAVDINQIYTIHYEKLSPDDHADINIESINNNAIHFPTLFSPKKSPKLIVSAEISKSYEIPKQIKLSNDEIDVVGIDLGTCRCCAAVNRKNGMETVQIDDKVGRLLPSVVEFNERRPICGQIAVDRLRHHANAIVFDSKRIIGRKFIDVEVDDRWPFEVVAASEEGEEVVIKLENFEVTAEEVAATLLKHIKDKIEEFQGKTLSEVVITVPAAFTDSQKDATLLAAKLAGWTTVELLPEPIAAAFTYFIDRPIPLNSTALLFDLGGGTLDVCIFKIYNNHIQIISRSGNLNLGGRDFDNLLFEYFAAKLKSDFEIENLGDKKYLLMAKCEDIKISLSVTDNATLDVDVFDSSKQDFINIKREEFERLSENMVFDVGLTIDAALKSIKLQPQNIEKVLQVGGGSRMPMIKNLLKEIFPNSEHCCETNHDEVVAVGAAYYAYHLNNMSMKKGRTSIKKLKRSRLFASQ